ncbi:hypothetical protein [Bradyrhizobium liaoningense]
MFTKANGVFAADIAKFVEKAKGNVDQAIRRAALDIFGRVVIKTPVDTGRLMGSWQVAIGSIPSGQVNHLDKTGTETIARINVGVANAKAGDVIYLVNNLVYARAIEYGHSRVKAPNGMVRITILEWNRSVERAAQSVPK